MGSVRKSRWRTFGFSLNAANHILYYMWLSIIVGLIVMYVMCDWVYQMTHCPDRAVRRRQLKTSWTSTGTSREPVRVMEPQVELLMMGQEVSKYCCVYLAITVIAVDASESGLLPSGFLELSALEFGAIYYRIYEKNTVKTQRKHSYYPLIVYVDRSLEVTTYFIR